MMDNGMLLNFFLGDTISSKSPANFEMNDGTMKKRHSHPVLKKIRRLHKPSKKRRALLPNRIKKTIINNIWVGSFTFQKKNNVHFHAVEWIKWVMAILNNISVDSFTFPKKNRRALHNRMIKQGKGRLTTVIGLQQKFFKKMMPSSNFLCHS